MVKKAIIVSFFQLKTMLAAIETLKKSRLKQLPFPHVSERAEGIELRSPYTTARFPRGLSIAPISHTPFPRLGIYNAFLF